MTTHALECTRDGVACGRFSLVEGSALRVGRGEEAGARIADEPFLSRVHVELSLESGALRVRKLAQAANPVFHDGSQKDEFRLEPGESFTIGTTRLRFIADGPAALSPSKPVPAGEPAPASRRLMERDEVYAVSDRMRLKDLLELPEILQSKDRNEFYLHIASMLRMATGAKWAAVISGDSRILGRDAARDDESFGVSATLREQAVLAAPRPVFYSWRQPAADLAATAHEGIDWAVCAAVELPGGEKLLFYAAGSGGAAEASSPANLDTTRYIGLVADIVGRSLSVRRHEEWETRLRRFFAKRVADQLLAGGDFQALEPKAADSTVLFFDIRGFSKLAEACEDILVFQRQLQRVMTAMTDEILKEDGVVLQYMGDGILACWNVPRPEADHVDRACRAALSMRKRLAEIEPSMRCGIGLHTGRVVAGTIGSEQIFAYGLIGTVINQASRVEGITKTVGAPILVTRAIAEKLTPGSGASATLLGLFRPAGMTADLELYELRAGARDADRAAAFSAAAEALRAARWADVAPALSALPADDGPARYLAAYAEKCSSVPPPAWRGVIELGEK